MSDPFSFLKLVKSPFTALYWVKTLMFVFGAGFLGFISYGVYKAYFKSPPDTHTQAVQIVSPQAGSHIIIGQKSDAAKGAMDPFIEFFVEGTGGFEGEEKYAGKGGVRVGVRF